MYFYVFIINIAMAASVNIQLMVISFSGKLLIYLSIIVTANDLSDNQLSYHQQ